MILKLLIQNTFEVGVGTVPKVVFVWDIHQKMI